MNYAEFEMRMKIYGKLLRIAHVLPPSHPIKRYTRTLMRKVFSIENDTLRNYFDTYEEKTN